MAQVVCSVKGIQLTEKCGSEGYRMGRGGCCLMDKVLRVVTFVLVS